jgi:hypothetical protein
MVAVCHFVDQIVLSFPRVVFFDVVLVVQPPPRICDIVPAEVSAMLNWLLRLWHRIDAWMHRQAGVSQQYHRSNLHGKHR